MFVEHLFEINPVTFLLILLTLIYLVYRSRGNSKPKAQVQYEETQIDFKTYIKPRENDSTILVMSYNIMAYNFTKIEWFPYVGPEYLVPKYRAPRIMNEIEKVNADIIGLQECDHDLFLEYYKVNLEDLGYTCIYEISGGQRTVTNVICYKKKLFRQESKQYLDLNEGFEKLDESFAKHKEALFVLLYHYSSKQRILVANTHLYWNPEYEYVKYGQISKVLTNAERNYDNGIPFVLCGDFNSLPKSNILKYVYKRPPVIDTNIKGDYSRNKKYMEYFWKEPEFQNHLQLRSAYDIYKVGNPNDYEEYPDNHPDFTTLTHEFSGTLDYIIYTADKLEVTELMRVPNHDPEVKAQKLPNSKYPSDHLKIGAKFRFKTKK